MTTVAAIARRGTVHMASDSMANIWDRPIISGVPKIHRHPAAGGGAVLLGCSGDAGLGTLIRSGLKLDAAPAGDDDGQGFADAVALAVTELARDAGLLENGRMSATALLGWHGHLWTISHAVAVRHLDGIAAIGSGEGPAMGAMHALLDTSLTDEQIVRAAVRVGITLDKHSDSPIVYEALTGPQSLAPGSMS